MLCSHCKEAMIRLEQNGMIVWICLNYDGINPHRVFIEKREK